MEEFTQTGNINEKWLNNIYENIKKLEEYERLVREGCSSLLDYVQIPLASRSIIIGLTQFKNLRFMITEFKLLLADLTPIIKPEAAIQYDTTLTNIDRALKSDRLFLTNTFDRNRRLVETKPTEFFYQTIEALHRIKVELFKEIKNILYITSEDKW